ncbi:MAG: serine hydrolase [Tissierellia bacterium]|nr:serine hydrolase [Tissierellia bacterium]
MANILERLEKVKGKAGFYYKNLVTKEEIGFNENETFSAASVIKLPILAVVFSEVAKGNAKLSDLITVKNSDKVPGCGALYSFTDEPTVDIQTLCNLLITISDNTATNVLIKHFTIEKISEEFIKLGLKDTKLKRLLFDSQASKKGIQNLFTPKEIGILLEQIYSRILINEKASEEILNILLQQQINHKIPGLLPDIAIAHKTGEDDGITHDVGIVYADEPFVVCFASNETNVAEFEQLIREISYELAG